MYDKSQVEVEVYWLLLFSIERYKMYGVGNHVKFMRQLYECKYRNSWFLCFRFIFGDVWQNFLEEGRKKCWFIFIFISSNIFKLGKITLDVISIQVIFY